MGKSKGKKCTNFGRLFWLNCEFLGIFVWFFWGLVVFVFHPGSLKLSYQMVGFRGSDRRS